MNNTIKTNERIIKRNIFSSFTFIYNLKNIYKKSLKIKMVISLLKFASDIFHSEEDEWHGVYTID